MEETLKLILNELKELKVGQQELRKDVSSIKDTLINGLDPILNRLGSIIDVKSMNLKKH